jgi:hypothetical protein
MKYIITLAFLVALCTTKVSAKQQIEYQVNNSYGDVVAAVERLANEPRKVPFKVPNLPALIEGKDIHITTDFRPSVRHYVVNITLENNIGKLNKFEKTLEVWGKKDSYIVRSTVDIGWDDFKLGILNNIKNKIVAKAECSILCLEKQKIMEYSARIETKPVEQPITWGKIASDTFDLMTLIVLKFEDVKQAKSVVKPKVNSAAKAKVNK